MIMINLRQSRSLCTQKFLCKDLKEIIKEGAIWCCLPWVLHVAELDRFTSWLLTLFHVVVLDKYTSWFLTLERNMIPSFQVCPNPSNLDLTKGIWLSQRKFGNDEWPGLVINVSRALSKEDDKEDFILYTQHIAWLLKMMLHDDIRYICLLIYFTVF